MVLALALLLAPPTRASEIEQGDRFWMQRAASVRAALARPERVEDAIERYRRALRGEASDEARWKLLRALHYLVEFTDAAEARKDSAQEEALILARMAAASPLESDADAATRARLYFWSAIAWGARAGRVGLLTIVREGVAGRMHDLAKRSASLDPSVDRGGPLRLLSRLHADLPRVPFISGWVDRAKALPYAEQALRLDPEHPGNQLVLALVLLERVPDRRSEALMLLERVAARDPDPDMLVEGLTIRHEARKRLADIERR
ncbi:MAG: hypothetical protein HKP27_01350 [Myxococcales bacterium]|nr:hypothetical protein [Myxococcales bacterium]